MLDDRISQQTALIKTNDPGGAPIRRLTVWRSIYSDIQSAEAQCPTLSKAVPSPLFSDPGRTGKQERTDRFMFVT